MKQLVCAVCLLGVSTPVLAAFFQQAEEEATAKSESPVKVNISGADAALADNLRAFMPSLRNLKCDSSSERVADFIEAAEEKLQEGAQAMGYYAAAFQVDSAQRANCWALDIAVQPGLPVKVTQVDVRLDGAGKDLKAFREITAKPPYQPGDVLVHKPYEDFKSSLNRAANNLGFFDAEYVVREIRVNPDTRQAQVKLQFDTGERYRVGKVTVGQDVLAEKYLNRYLKVKPGDVYQADTLLKQQRILDSSGYFSDVQVSGGYRDAKDGAVPVGIVAERRKRYTYEGQVGYGSDTGLRVGAEMDIHWVNDKGHNATVTALASENLQGGGMTYKVPLWEPEHEYTSLDVDLLHVAEEGFEVQGVDVELNYNRRTKTDWQQTVFVRSVNESLDIDGFPEAKSQLSLLGARLKKTSSDDVLLPTQGWQLAAEVKGSKASVLSDQSVLQGQVDGKYLHTFANRDKLLLGGRAGASQVDDFTELPRELRFFAGGQNSVRGYDFESIGGASDEGVVLGAQHLLAASVEYEHPVKDNWSVAGFVDAGDAFDAWSDMNPKVGAGVGVRYKSPLGPIRADFAAPKDDPGDVHFYFSLGPDL